MDAWHILLECWITLLEEYMYFPADWSRDQIKREVYDQMAELTAEEASNWLRQIAADEMVLVLSMNSRRENKPPDLALQAA